MTVGLGHGHPGRKKFSSRCPWLRQLDDFLRLDETSGGTFFKLIRPVFIHMYLLVYLPKIPTELKLVSIMCIIKLVYIYYIEDLWLGRYLPIFN